MKTNDLKAGAKVRLRNGWAATLSDNARGNIRYARVEGFVTEIGSIYAFDIMHYWDEREAAWKDVTHTPEQLKTRKKLKAFGLAILLLMLVSACAPHREWESLSAQELCVAANEEITRQWRDWPTLSPRQRGVLVKVSGITPYVCDDKRVMLKAMEALRGLT